MQAARLSRWGCRLTVLIAALTVAAIAPDDASQSKRSDSSGRTSSLIQADSPSTPDSEVVRVSGDDRFQTAAALARKSDAAREFWLSTGFEFADALAAGSTNRGPILLTVPPAVPDATLNAAAARDVDTVLAAGGESAVASDQLVEVAGAATSGWQRLGGVGRWETAAEIALDTHPEGVDTVYLATGADFPDGLTAGAVAAAHGAGLLLTAPDELPPATRGALADLSPDVVIAVGGTAALTDNVLHQASVAADEAATHRVAGTQRFQTAAALTEHAFPDGTDTVYVATGDSWPDALTASAAAAADDAALLLNSTDELLDESRAALERLEPSQIFVVGGTAAVPQAVEQSLVDLVNPTDRDADYVVRNYEEFNAALRDPAGRGEGELVIAVADDIDDFPGQELFYEYTEGDSTDAIRIESYDGERYTLDAEGGSRILHLESDGVQATPDLHVEDLRFVDGRSPELQGGGAIKLRGDFVVRRSEFVGNRADGAGGGVLLRDQDRILVEDSSFELNTSGLAWEETAEESTAFRWGGAIAAVETPGSAPTTILDSKFESNTAKQAGGGAIYVASGDVQIEGAVFKDNRATIEDESAPTHAYFGGGAVVAVPPGTMTVSDSQFEANRSGRSGGALQGVDRIVESVFKDNVAEGGVAGAALVPNEVINSDFFGNESRGTGVSRSGGAVIASAIIDSTFEGNVSAGGGGAARAPYVEGSVFVDNEAAEAGGAVTCECAIELISTTFERNRAGEEGGAAAALSFPDEPDPLFTRESVYVDNTEPVLWGQLEDGGGNEFEDNQNPFYE